MHLIQSKLQSEKEHESSSKLIHIKNNDHTLKDKSFVINEQLLTIKNLKSENLALRNDISLINFTLNNSNKDQNHLAVDNIKSILTNKENSYNKEFEQELTAIKSELVLINQEYFRLQTSHRYTCDELKIKEEELSRLSEKVEISSNEILTAKLVTIELEHESKSSRGKHLELIGEIEVYKKELDELKLKCT